MAHNSSINLDPIINSDGYSLGGGTTKRTFTLSGADYSILLSSTAQGDILYNNGSNWVNLSADTSGKFLKTQGVGANPAWSLVTEASLSLSNNTTNDATTLRHGFLPILSGNATQYLNGQGNFAIPSGTANSYTSVGFTNQTSVNVIHNFGAYPVVQVINGSNAEIIPQSTTHNTLNDFTITFTSSTTGTIIASVGSPQAQQVIAVNADYVVLTTDRIIKVTALGKTITLPTAINNTGREFIINNASTGNITVNTTSSQTINNLLSQIVPSNSTMVVYSDGSNYWII